MHLSRKICETGRVVPVKTSEKQRRGSGPTKSKKAAHLDRVYCTGTKANGTKPESWRCK